MKLRFSAIVFLLAMLLTACNFTLASDITPPPGYIAPTSMPTLGPLYPSRAPSVQNGAAIFAQKCAACHGDAGLGDGPQSGQLPYPVAALGLPEIAQAASPAQWFKTVSRGNIDRGMPPFVSLSEQERWDVIAYALSLHITPGQLAQGKSLFEASCGDCAAKFSNQEKLAALSEADLIRIIRNGDGNIPAFGRNFTDDEAAAVAAYIRALTFAPPLTSTPMAAAVSTESAPAVSGTPEAATATGSVPEATPMPGKGSINGKVEIAGGGIPAGLTVTLHGIDQTQDQSAAPQEALSLTTTSAADGSYAFENVDMPANRVFAAEVDFNGVTFQSDLIAVTKNTSQITLPTVKLYEASEDTGLLSVEQIHIYPDFAADGTVQFFEIYAFSNKSGKAVIISKDGTNMPFIKIPANAQSVGYQPGQNSAPFSAAGNGVAAPPSDQSYSIIAFFTFPYNNKLEIKQPFTLDTPPVILLLPEGVKVESDQLTSRGVQSFQNANFEEFSSGDLKAGDTLAFTLSGQPNTGSASTTAPNTARPLLIGAGILGIALIGAGAWLYFRDRRAEETEDENEFESSEEVMDAILALDDLHRAGKIPDEAYHERRDELKQILKEMA